MGTTPAVSVSDVSCREGDECGARTCMVGCMQENIEY